VKTFIWLSAREVGILSRADGQLDRVSVALQDPFGPTDKAGNEESAW
jgi:hypothetical protein